MMSESGARCGTCGARYTSGRWAALPCVRVVSGEEAQAHALGWPRERAVEVRACASCGGNIARLRAEAAA